MVGEFGLGQEPAVPGRRGLLAGNGKATAACSIAARNWSARRRAQLNDIRGSKITMIFQDPLTSLTPHMRIGDQIVEALATHKKMARSEAERRALATLELVRIPEGKRRHAAISA